MIELPRRRMILAVALILVAGGGVGRWSARPTPGAAPPVARALATAPVVRTDLASTIQLSAMLGYAGVFEVVTGAPGVLTALPTAGQAITRGQTVYELDGVAVPLFYGSRPMWRAFAPGMMPGPDIRQLEENLVSLGVSNLHVGDTFTAATSAAIRRWQVATGHAVTGTMAVGAVCFQPGPLRVATVSSHLGSTAMPGAPILEATSPTPVVNLPVPAQQTFLVHAGDAVTVTLPNGTTTPATVGSVSTVASLASGPEPQSGPVSAILPAQVSLRQPSAVANLDQAPVTVNVTDHLVKGVLVVPITALVALAGGGYGVYVDQQAPPARRLVAVTPGLFATTLVQVTPAGGGVLQAGDQVEVPLP